MYIGDMKNNYEKFYDILSVVEYYCETIIDEGKIIEDIQSKCNQFLISDLDSNAILEIGKNKECLDEVQKSVKILLQKCLLTIEKSYGLVDGNDIPSHVMQFIVDLQEVCEKGLDLEIIDTALIDEIEGILDQYVIDEDSIYA